MSGRIIPLIAIIGAGALVWFALTPAKQSPITRMKRTLPPSAPRSPKVRAPKTSVPIYTPPYEFSAFEPVSYLKSGATAGGNAIQKFVGQFKSAVRNVSPSILNLLRGAADAHGVPANILTAQAFKESTFNPNARSSANAYGLMQLVQKWHPDTPVENPVDNAYRGAEYLREQYDTFGDWQTALMAYNMGPNALKAKGPSKGAIDYANKILTAAKVYA